MKFSLRRFVNKNIRNLFIVFVLMLFVTGLYTENIIPSIINITFAPFELNYERAFESKNLVVLTDSSETDQLNNENDNKEQYNQIVDGINNQRKFDVEAQRVSDFMNVYKQNNKYKFEINPIEVYDLGLFYETSYSISTDGIDFPYAETAVTHKYILLDTGKALVLTKIAPDFDIDKHQSYKGVFLPLSDVLVNDVRKNLRDGQQLNNIFCYELDTITSVSSYENSVMIFLFVLLIIVIITGIKLIIYRNDYRKHPTYKQLYKLYGNPYENEISLDTDLSDEAKVVVNKNIYETENWKVTRGTFKTKISMVKKSSRFD